MRRDRAGWTVLIVLAVIRLGIGLFRPRALVRHGRFRSPGASSTRDEEGPSSKGVLLKVIRNPAEVLQLA